MKVVILAGGYGTRISEETTIKPKPMVEIAGKPILWHIMKNFSQQGFSEFVILLGYKGYSIKEYFANFFLHQSDVTIHTGTNQMEAHNSQGENWKVTLVETGLDTMTGSRIIKAKKYLQNERFLLTYGDGLANINLAELVEFHESKKGLLTVTAVQPEGRFGNLDIDGSDKVTTFLEKPRGDGQWVNGGFFVVEPEFFKFLSNESDQIVLEKEPLESCAKAGVLHAYKHDGFWKCMDTLRDKNQLEHLWNSKAAPWKNWDS